MASIITGLATLILHLEYISAASTADGREFVISAPSSTYEYSNETGYPRLVLIIQSIFDNATVRISTRGLMTRQQGSLQVNETVTLRSLSSLFFSKPALYYGPELATGFRWAYHLVGMQPFGVVVSLENSSTVAETFTAVPVPGWGAMYYAVTLESFFSVILITNEFDNTISFTVRSEDEGFRLKVDDILYANGKSFNIEMSPYQAYAISHCRQNRTDGFITGSKITGVRPFGVVSGNCDGRTYTRLCSEPNEGGFYNGTTGSPVAEMILPTQTAGKSFILFNVTGRMHPGFYMVTSVNDYAVQVRISTDLRQPENLDSFIIFNGGDSVTREAGHKFMLSSGPVQVVYVQNSSCVTENGTGGNDGGPSMMIMVPVQLFYHMYIALVPETDMKHYMVLVIQPEYAKYIHSLFGNGSDPIIKDVYSSPKPVKGFDSHDRWSYYVYEVKKNASIVVLSLKTRFGLYLHGVNNASTYMHPAGFISSNINKKMCEKTLSTMRMADLLDNDCDGYVDEEILNELNDDISKAIDKSIDEDLGIYFSENDTSDTVMNYHPAILHEHELNLRTETFTTLGYDPRLTSLQPATFTTGRFHPQIPDEFSEWTAWACTHNCKVQEMVRTRQCVRPAVKTGCTGPLSDIKLALCYPDICPKDCPDTSFGVGCKLKCDKCTSACDKFNGSCQACQPGYDYPETGCQEDRRAYGEWTNWQCSEDCPTDPLLYRKRLCKPKGSAGFMVNCTNPIVDKMAGECYSATYCPNSCSNYKWGFKCFGSSPNCVKPCNKFTGICDSCKPGFENPQTSCLTLSVETAHWLTLSLLLLFFIPFAAIAFYMLKQKHRTDTKGTKSKESVHSNKESSVNEVEQLGSQVKSPPAANSVISKIKSLTSLKSTKEDAGEKKEPLSTATSRSGGFKDKGSSVDSDA